MRVANVIEEGKLGGPQVRMVRVAAALKGQADTLIVMPWDNSEPFRALCEEADVKFHAMPLTRITTEWRVALRYVLFSVWEVIQLARLLRNENIDLVHASGGSWQYKGVIAARLAGIPSVWHLNDTSMPKWVRVVFGCLKPLANGFIFASHRSEDYYGSALAEKLSAVVPSTVDTDKFDPSSHHEKQPHCFNALGDAPVLGTVANINPIKGLELLIEAFAHARKKHADLKLLIVGPAHANQLRYQKSLLELTEQMHVAEHIVWAGAQTDVQPFLARMDVYACSSVAESSPVSVWEAMAMARPVVSSDVGDVSRHIQSGTNGIVVPERSAETFAQAIVTLLDDATGRGSMGDKARQTAQDFSPNSVAGKTFAIYRSVLTASRQSAGQ